MEKQNYSDNIYKISCKFVLLHFFEFTRPRQFSNFQFVFFISFPIFPLKYLFVLFEIACMLLCGCPSNPLFDTLHHNNVQPDNQHTISLEIS